MKPIGENRDHKEPQVGCVYEYNGQLLRVGVGGECGDCYFFDERDECVAPKFFIDCIDLMREDEMNVIYTNIGRTNRFEPEIGAICYYAGYVLETIECSPSGGCDFCFFRDMKDAPCTYPDNFFSLCSMGRRSDDKCVNFKYVDSYKRLFDPQIAAQKISDLYDYTESTEKYESLERVLDDAFEQASTGKGRSRHATDDAFEDQVICVVQRLLKDHPFGGGSFQAIKKTIEAGRLYKTKGADAAYQEILGAQVYLGGIGVLLNEEREGK